MHKRTCVYPAGSLGVLSGHTFEAITVNNTELCGPVPVSVRSTPGFDRTNTRLGQPWQEDSSDGRATLEDPLDDGN